MSVKQKFTGDVSQLERELSKLQQQYQKMLDSSERAANASNKQADKTSLNLEKWAIGLASTAAGYVSVQQAIQLVNAEMQRQLDLQKRASGFSVSVAASQAAVVQNAGVGANEAQAFLNKVAGVQKETGFASNAQLNMAAASVLSATGSDRDKTLEILKATAPIFRYDGEGLAPFAGGVADLMSASGSTAEEATALALAGFGNSRTTSLTAFKNVAQSIKSGQSFLQGVDDKQAAEEITGLFGTLSRFSGDSEGASTRTASVKFLQKLEEFGGAGSTLERLARVQQGIADGSIKSDSVLKGFEAQSIGAVRDILTNSNSPASRDLVETISKTKGSVEDYRNLVNSINTATPQLRAAYSEARFEGAVESSYLSPGGTDLSIRDRILELDRRAQQELGNNMDGFQIPVIGPGLSDLANYLSTTPELLDSYQLNYQGRLGRLLGDDGKANNEQERRDAALLRSVIEELKGIRTELNTTRKQPNPIAQGAAQDERG